MNRIVYFIPYSFFQDCQTTFIARMIERSRYAFALIETIHIITLAVLLGTVVVIDLRLLGVWKEDVSPTEFSKMLGPWSWTSLVIMVITGVAMFLSEATRMSRSAPFYFKMFLLVFAIAVYFIRGRVAESKFDSTPWLSKMVACISLLCWFGVALAGRVIAFF